MAGPFKKLIVLFDTEEERDKAFKRKLEKDFRVASNERVITKITRRNRKEGGTLYGYEVKQA